MAMRANKQSAPPWISTFDCADVADGLPSSDMANADELALLARGLDGQEMPVRPSNEGKPPIDRKSVV